MQLDEYIDRLKGGSVDYRLNVDLSKFCSYGTGGRGAVVVFPENAEQFACAACENFPYEVIGSGTNVLFSDGGYDGAIVCTTRMTKIECSGLSIIAECGARLSDVRETAAMNSLGGLEFSEGIPATVGGAVCMNAGCFSKCVGDYVSYVVTNRGVLSGAECGFGYRTSVFLRNNAAREINRAREICGGATENDGGATENDGKGEVADCNGKGEVADCNGKGGTTEIFAQREQVRREILSVCFLLKPGEPDVIEAKRERFKKLRKRAQPHGKSCGSVFLNDGYFAGKLIDTAGLKGAAVGGARVSDKHANFILAEHGATSSDIYSLIAYVKKRVFETQGVALKEELRYIGKFDDRL